MNDGGTGAQATERQLLHILGHINKTWKTLERSHSDLLTATADDKVAGGAEHKPLLYVSAKEDLSAIRDKLRQAAHEGECDKIELRRLPADWREITQHGLLYLPNHYIVPGGSFNEMYGWDSYFIQLGLLRDGHLDFARETTENHLYQVRMYGTVLNANRTYYLTRSQPPFLSQMALDIFRVTDDRAWLERALPAIETHYRYWTEGPRSVDELRMSRYYDFSDEPAPEVFLHERDARGRTHYDRVADFYRARGAEIDDYDLPLYYDRAANALTPLFYRADRAMRESGHDPSNRFGAFNAGVLDILPVDLNCLLYRMELDLEDIHNTLGSHTPAGLWKGRAEERSRRINDLMWDEPRGLYFDYDYTKRARRLYPYVTAFFPMWAGVASTEQAAAIVANLPLLEQPGGLQTSTNASGSQWDAPIGWAPMQLIAVQGLRRYGYNAIADRISINFLSMILKDFLEHDVLLEKYEVVERGSNVETRIQYGYSVNEVGFGWTNATFLELLAALPPEGRDGVRRLDGAGSRAADED